MARVGWVTDLHLDWVERPKRREFYEVLHAAGLDFLLVGGDIGVAHSLPVFLSELQEAVHARIYFVLGNHDYYGSSIAAVTDRVCRQAAASTRLHWLASAGVIRLSESTALVGHGSWADGRLGDFFRSQVLLNDYLLIEELAIADEMRGRGAYEKGELFRRLNSLGDEAAQFIRVVLAEALKAYPKVVVLTHVPPFRESCWHEGRISTDDYLPHFACQAFGQALVDVLDQHPDRTLMVLCGHTHSSGFVQLRDNLAVWTGGAEYGRPILQQVFEL